MTSSLTRFRKRLRIVPSLTPHLPGQFDIRSSAVPLEKFYEFAVDLVEYYHLSNLIVKFGTIAAYASQ